VRASAEPWQTSDVASWQEFDEQVRALTRFRWLFRGQGEAHWGLQTSLRRAFAEATVIKRQAGNKRGFRVLEHERLLIDRFRRSAHLYRTALPGQNDPLEWLGIMQHYGAPTRLLDVTLSPHIAAYFALDQGAGDSAVFAFDHRQLRPASMTIRDFERRALSESERHGGVVYAFSPRLTTERLLAQQGAFLAPSSIEEDFEDVLRGAGAGGGTCRKLVIPAALRWEGIDRLKRMNITSTSLFPGIDGFCRSLRFQIHDPVKNQARLE